MDLYIHSHKVFKWQFHIFQDDEQVADIDLNLLKEGADIEIKGETFRMFREGLVSGDFVLQAYGKEIVRADKPSVFKRRFAVHFAGRRFILEAVSAFRRTFVAREELEDGSGVEVGRMTPIKWYKRSATVRFDDDLPLAVDIFMIALVLLMWKRSAESSS